MEYIDARGAKVPALGFGTWQLSGETCYEAVRDALEIGYRHIDTARMYGNEEEVGRAIRDAGIDPRECFLATKLWRDELSADAVGPAVSSSLDRLGVDTIDLLMIHWPTDDVDLEETLGAMVDQQLAGRVKHLGVCNFTPSLLGEALGWAEIISLQVEYHPFLDQSELRAICQDEGLLMTAYSPLAQGRVADDPTLQEIAEAHGKTPTQVALRWLTLQPQVAAIPRSSKSFRRKENYGIWDLQLTDEDIARISSLAGGDRLVDPGFAPEWRT